MGNEEFAKLISEIMSCSIESSKQEIARSNILLTKSDYLMKYISAAFVIVNAISAFAVLNSFIPAGLICIYYLVVGMLLMISMYFTIQAQILLKVEYFPTGKQVLDGMVSKWNDTQEICTLQDIQKDNIIYYSKYTESLKQANDERAKKLHKAYRFFMLATVGVTLGFFIFLMIIA